MFSHIPMIKTSSPPSGLPNKLDIRNISGWPSGWEQLIGLDATINGKSGWLGSVFGIRA